MIYRLANDTLTAFTGQWEALTAAVQAIPGNAPANAALADARGRIAVQLAIVQGRPTAAQSLDALVAASTAIIVDDAPIIEGFLDDVPAGAKRAQAELASEVLEAIVQLANDTISEVAELRTNPVGNEGPASSLRGINNSVESLNTFPILTADAGFGGGSSSGGGSGISSTSYRSKVDIALRELLGSVPRADDTRAVVAALTGSFSVREVDGHTEVKWLQRSFAGSSTLAGRISGSQLSLLNRAKDMVNSALNLLRGFQPLKVDYDPQEVDAIRKINENELTNLLSEIGREGGPLVSKVDSLFNSLLGGVNNDGGHIADLAFRFGFEEDQVITLDEEFTNTNFQTYHDTVADFRRSWRDYVVDGGNDLGTNFLLLDRALTVSSQTVDEILRAMDSVYVEEAARQVSYFHFQNRRVVLQDFLDWVAEFAGAQAPKQIHDGGRRGAEAIVPIVQTIGLELDHLITVIAVDPGLPKALAHPRVRRPLIELQTYLERVEQLATEVANPRVPNLAHELKQ